ncbi:MAG: hypothetical protein KAG53_12080 [Endozoicomonadaceae bacterium]|nr:hypothetical protein [Endozoicomonadaceae bacterium]
MKIMSARIMLLKLAEINWQLEAKNIMSEDRINIMDTASTKADRPFGVKRPTKLHNKG